MAHLRPQWIKNEQFVGRKQYHATARSLSAIIAGMSFMLIIRAQNTVTDFAKVEHGLKGYPKKRVLPVASAAT
jgi:H2-forming N5,N10-methylenetetrahydromethanopterin dehydrogenase-like enzyme